MPRLRRMSLLNVENLKMHFPVRGGILMRALKTCKAVDGVSISVSQGETLGLVGESGCGKTTLGKAIVRLYQPTDGKLQFEGQDITRASQRALRPIRRDIQMIFQDPAESLNPRLTVRDILEEPFLIQKQGTTRNAASGWGNCSTRSDWPLPLPTVSPSSFPAASVSASALPAPSRSSPS